MSLCGAKRWATGAILRKLILRGNFFYAIDDEPQLCRLLLFARRDGQAAKCLLGYGQLLALDAGDLHAAVVAQQLHAAAPQDREQGLGPQFLEIDVRNRRSCIRGLARPAVQRKVAAVGRRSGDDKVGLADAFDASDTALPEVEFDRRDEPGAHTVAHFQHIHVIPVAGACEFTQTGLLIQNGQYAP